MKTIFFILPVMLLMVSCGEDTLMKLETTIGTSFVISAPAEVTLKENGARLYFSNFTNYRINSIVISRTYAEVLYNDKKYMVSNIVTCDTCSEKVSLENNLELVYEKIIEKTCVSACDNNAEFRIDRAQFVLKSVN